jgi:hypothetical protein
MFVNKFLVMLEQVQCLFLDTVAPYGIFVLAVADLGLEFIPVAYNEFTIIWRWCY